MTPKLEQNGFAKEGGGKARDALASINFSAFFLITRKKKWLPHINIRVLDIVFYHANGATSLFLYIYFLFLMISEIKCVVTLFNSGMTMVKMGRLAVTHQFVVGRE